MTHDMNTSTFKVGDIVKYIAPFEDEKDLLLEIVEDNQTRGYAKVYYGRERVGMIENSLTLVQYSEIELHKEA